MGKVDESSKSRKYPHQLSIITKSPIKNYIITNRSFPKKKLIAIQDKYLSFVSIEKQMPRPRFDETVVLKISQIWQIDFRDSFQNSHVFQLKTERKFKFFETQTYLKF